MVRLLHLRIAHPCTEAAEGSGARGVVASKPLIDAVQQVLGEAVPGTRQHLLKANDRFEAEPWGEGNKAGVSTGLNAGCKVKLILYSYLARACSHRQCQTRFRKESGSVLSKSAAVFSAAFRGRDGFKYLKHLRLLAVDGDTTV